MRRLTLPARVENLPRVAALLDEALTEAGCDELTVLRLQLAAEEVFVNIARHAYPEGDGEAGVEAGVRDGRFVLRFTDSGPPFNPLERADPDVNLPAEEREPGGLGIFLARKNVDRMEYVRRDGLNTLTMTLTL